MVLSKYLPHPSVFVNSLNLQLSNSTPIVSLMNDFINTLVLIRLSSFLSMLVQFPLLFTGFYNFLTIILWQTGPRLCLGREFAYNETSFILIRLFQVFESVSLAPDAQPVWSRPPVSWKAAGVSGKRKSKEEIWPKADLTMYAHVGHFWVSFVYQVH
jgi:hypothetical protein